MTTSSRIGEKLLAGWTLLGESCPRAGCAAPLLKPRDGGALYCPQHDGEAGPLESSPSSEGGYDSSTHADQRLGPFARGAPAAEPAAVAPVVPSHAQAGVIADYLLRGWTMLGEACPLPGCHAPLMANRRQGDTRKFCPVHALWVLSEAEAKLQAGPLEEVPSVPASAATASAAEEVAPEERGGGASTKEGDAPLLGEEARLGQRGGGLLPGHDDAALARAGAWVAAGEPGLGTALDAATPAPATAAVLPRSPQAPTQAALDAVAGAMTAAAAQLNTGGLSDLGRASALVRLLADCGAATAALRAL